MLVSEIQGNHSEEPKTILQRVSKMFAKCIIIFFHRLQMDNANANANYNKCEKKKPIKREKKKSLKMTLEKYFNLNGQS